jgi:hypothetical protein
MRTFLYGFFFLLYTFQEVDARIRAYTLSLMQQGVLTDLTVLFVKKQIID